MTDFTMAPVSLLAAEYGDGNPVIVEEFTDRWRRQTYRKRASASWLRKLRRAGVTHVAVETPHGTTADYTTDELVRSA